MNCILSTRIFYIIALEPENSLNITSEYLISFEKCLNVEVIFSTLSPPGKYRYDITRFAVIKISSFLLQNSFLSSFQASPLFYFTSPNACAPNPQSNLYPLVIEILEFSLKAFHFSFFKSVSLEHFPATIDNLLRKIFHFFLRF